MSGQQTEAVLPSRDLMLKISILGTALAVFGLLITGDFGKPWSGMWYFPGLGYALFDVGLGALLIFIFVERLLSMERKLVQDRERRRWDAIRDKVKKLIAAELSGIASEMINATNASQPAMAGPDATNEQIEEQARRATFKEMEKMSEDRELLRANAEQAALSILDRQYGDLFAQRAERLGDLQLRYWSHFLDPKTVAYLVDLEQALETLDIHTKITQRERQHPARKRSIEEALTGMYDQEVYRDLQTILKLIVEGVHENLIEIP
jgi:hypothetical protein